MIEVLSGRYHHWWRFWRIFPNNIIGILSMGLVIAGLMMIITPDLYRSFYLDVGPFRLTPLMGGLASVVCALTCLGTRASYVGLGLVAATFAGRGALLFTAWATARVDPPPPPTRWLWEVVNVFVILIAAGRIRRTYR